MISDVIKIIKCIEIKQFLNDTIINLRQNINFYKRNGDKYNNKQ